jgi:hypothetical protein
MLLFVVRGLILALSLWLLWRLCVALFPVRRPEPPPPPDDWAEVLESIQALPETGEPPHRADDQRRPQLPEA